MGGMLAAYTPSIARALLWFRNDSRNSDRTLGGLQMATARRCAAAEKAAALAASVAPNDRATSADALVIASHGRQARMFTATARHLNVTACRGRTRQQEPAKVD